MKKKYNKEISKSFYQVFLRFLKSNNIYDKFLIAHKRCCCKNGIKKIDLIDDSLDDIMKRYNLTTLRDLFLHNHMIYWDIKEENFWFEFDYRWYTFYYKNKIYTYFVK